MTQTSDLLQSLNYLCKDSESIEILGKIQDQIDILQQSAELVSSSAEVRPNVSFKDNGRKKQT
jgi:hypothetical protein